MGGWGTVQANTFPVQWTQEPVSNELNSMGSSKAKTDLLGGAKKVTSGTGKAVSEGISSHEAT